MDASAQGLIDEALVELPGCPRPLAAMALRDVVTELLQRSTVLRVELTAINIVADTYLYTLALPSGYDGYKINRPTLVLVDGEEQRAGIDYRMASRTSLQLRDTPAAAITSGLEVTVALALDDIQTADLSDLEDWYSAIVAGVKSRLMLMPRKPWTDQATGMVYRSEYYDGLSRAMLEAAVDNTGQPQRVSA